MIGTSSCISDDIENLSERCSDFISELFDSAVLRVGKPAREMNKADRLRVIEYLSSMDAFSYRRAVPYVASHLGVSRYTVYKYLDEVNGKINKASAKDKED